MKTNHLLPVLFAALIFPSANAQMLDPSFGNGGVVVVNADGGKEEVQGFVLQNDGKMLVMGDSYEVNSKDFYLIRLETNGAIDTNFGSNGLVHNLFSDLLDDSANDAVCLENGQIMVLGKKSYNPYLAPVLVRLNYDGSLDTPFMGFGFGTYPIFSGINNFPQSLNQLSDGGLLMTGRFGSTGDADIFLIKTDLEGGTDYFFGNMGWTYLDVLGEFDTLDDLIVMPGDLLIGAGRSFDPEAESHRLLLVKFQSDGGLDNSFGDNGVVIGADSGGDDAYRAIAKYGDDHFLVAGYTAPNGDKDIIVSRYDLNGILDLSFGDSGHIILDNNGHDDLAIGVAELWDGSILIGAQTESDNGENIDFTLIKLNNDGNLVTDFGNGGWFIHDQTDSDVAEKMVLQPDGKVLLAGSVSENGEDGDVMLIRVAGVNPTSIEDYNSAIDFNLSPNPTHSVLRITGDDQMAEIAVLSTNGRLIQQWGIKQLPTEIDITSLAAGQYILRRGEVSKPFVKVE